MKIRTIIIDDESLARERLRRLLLEDAGIEIIGEAANGRQAVQMILEMRPDLIFLDVQMPGKNGFDVLQEIEPQQSLPAVIFVTAYDGYALQAFEVHALDYLLKPFNRARFNQALERAKQQLQQRQNGDLTEKLLALLQPSGNQLPLSVVQTNLPLKRIVVKTAERISFLDTDQINWVEAAGNYVRLHTRNATAHLVRETLSSLESKLDPQEFIRIHRSSIVKIAQIKELHPLFHGDYQMTLHCGTRLTLSRNYRKSLQNCIGQAF